MGISKSSETAIGMSLSIAFVMTISYTVSFIIDKFILVPLHLENLRTIVFILIIAALVQFVEMVIEKNLPQLYAGLGIYLPLITINCAVLGVALLNVQYKYTFLEMLVFSF